MLKIDFLCFFIHPSPDDSPSVTPFISVHPDLRPIPKHKGFPRLKKFGDGYLLDELNFINRLLLVYIFADDE